MPCCSPELLAGNRLGWQDLSGLNAALGSKEKSLRAERKSCICSAAFVGAWAVLAVPQGKRSKWVLKVEGVQGGCLDANTSVHSQSECPHRPQMTLPVLALNRAGLISGDGKVLLRAIQVPLFEA